MSALERPIEPVCVLIAALGGEGGGVLCEWLVDAATRAGYPVQGTSVPGVAQRTGATTYYVEIYPVLLNELGGQKPVLGLFPVAGRVDLVVASEPLEAARVMQAGYIDPARTTLVSSRQRTLTTLEKIQPGDGRLDSEVLFGACAAMSARSAFIDMAKLARDNGTVISAVMFGTIFGSGTLPFERDHYEAAITDSGIGVAASLRGFEAGRAAVASLSEGSIARTTPAGPSVLAQEVPPPFNLFPEPCQDIIQSGWRRVTEFQDPRYGGRYLYRLNRVALLERKIDPTAKHGHRILHETARFLALWMAFDDVIRVADFKTRRDRFERIRAEVGAKSGEIVRVSDYFKPRLIEAAGLLPQSLATRLLGWNERRRTRLGRNYREPAFAMRLRSDSGPGYLMLRMLSAMRWLRPHGARFTEEQRRIETWLAAIDAAGESGQDAAFEIALCGRLVKGYGSTNERAHENLGRILELLTRLSAAGTTPAALAAALRAAREAALEDGEGRALDRSIAPFGLAPRAPKAHPINFVKKPRSDRATVGRNAAPPA